ncbi:MAG: AtpZ/AtpI family protein [Burkholderiaceae bacterium]|nr:AtpZ/AtpI family protein [Burkholderiaceae bacterium]
MIEEPKILPKSGSTLAGQVGTKAARKLKARRSSSRGVWFGLGMMGLIGWSVTVPTLLGAGIGLWLDQHDPGGRSWTLALLVAGLMIGCLNAWHWVSKEDRAMREEQEDHDDE